MWTVSVKGWYRINLDSNKKATRKKALGARGQEERETEQNTDGFALGNRT